MQWYTNPTPREPPAVTDSPSRPPARFGSDVIVDQLIDHGIRHVSLNPGASYRGVHDSLVNRPGAPEVITCTHEKTAVNIAHGYAKASGRPMGTILHNVVGLLHGSLGLYSARLDRAPILAMGGSGPQDATRRRPWIDWLHTANIQGNAVRDFVKWDEQPASIGAFPEAFARALRTAVSEPSGPVYIAMDAWLQEQEVEGPVPVMDPAKTGAASRLGPDPQALEEAAEALVAAERPLLIAGFAGRDPRAFGWVPELAELLGAAIIDTDDRLNAPSTHPLNLTGTDVIGESDAIAMLDIKDASRFLLKLPGRSASRATKSLVAEGATVIDIGFGDLQLLSWVHDVGPVLPIDIRVAADTSIALPMLLELVRDRVAREPQARRDARAARAAAITERHDAARAGWAAQVSGMAAMRPIAPPWLAREVGEAIREYDWVLTAGSVQDWALKLWDFDRSYRHPGRTLGTATQIGISLGVALAHRGSGKLVVDLQPDGDLLFDGAAPWIAAAHGIPMLVVMVNNRAYFNDWEHQIKLAEQRGSDMARVPIGVEIDGPAPDFAMLAKAFGWYAEGPIEDPAAIRDAVKRAARVVMEQGKPALVDVVTAHR